MNACDIKAIAFGGAIGSAGALRYTGVVSMRSLLLAAAFVWIGFLAVAFARGLAYGD